MIQYTPSPIVACTNFNPMQLPQDFQPRSMDILCGRGRGVWEHEGNRRFKAQIESHAEKYSAARTRMDKGVVIASMVDSIREEGILFVKRDGKTQCWFDIGEYKAREKTSHAMRDYIAKSSGASTKNTQQSNSRARDAVQKQREVKYTQQPTAQKEIIEPRPLCVSSCHKKNTATPEIFERLGLDYLSFFEQEINELMISSEEKIASQAAPCNTLDSIDGEEEGLQWSELFPVDVFDDFQIQCPRSTGYTSYAYAA